MTEGVTVLMLAHDRDMLTARSVDSIRRFYRDQDEVQILVVSDKHQGFTSCIDQIDLLDLSGLRWWTNPCIPMNLGFTAAKHEKIIFQGGENYHRGDLIRVVRQLLTDDMYMVFGCYSLDRSDTFGSLDRIVPREDGLWGAGRTGWYQHSRYNPRRFHFTAAMTKKTLRRIGGFSEEFATGIAFDDDDFVRKVDANKICTLSVDSPFTLHQFHYDGNYPPNYRELVDKNKALFEGKWGIKP